MVGWLADLEAKCLKQFIQLGKGIISAIFETVACG
jgi:hypothetical protein